MKDFELFKKTDEIIAKFPNGEEMFHKSPLFNRTVQMLARDVDPYEVITQLIFVAEDSQNALAQHIIREPFTYRMPNP